jgi:hypothetical protein
MANFQVSITNPSTALVDISDSNDVLTIVDHSNYDDASPEAGHNQSDFDAYRKLRITLPTGTTYLFSSEYPADGDETLAVPNGAALPMSTDYAYTTGDGKYTIELFVLPTWGVGYAYLVGTAPYVIYSGVLYKCLQDSTGDQPDTSPTYWEVVADMDDLPSKYQLEQNITVTSDMKEVWARLVYMVNCVNNQVGCRYEELLRDPMFFDSIRLCLTQDSIPVLMKVDAWDEVESNVNFSKEVAAKYGY